MHNIRISLAAACIGVATLLSTSTALAAPDAEGPTASVTAPVDVAPVEDVSPVEQTAPEGVQDDADDSASALAAGYGGTITRSEVVQRAKYWWDKQVPYSQTKYYRDVNGGKSYRTDCSGFVSMAWKLTSSMTTRTLPKVSRAIAWSALKPGDIVLRNGHVKLFERWADTAKTSMWIYEQGSTSSDMNHTKVSVSSLKNGGYAPRAYNKIK